MIEQSGVASSEKGQLSMKQREHVKLKESRAKNTKPSPGSLQSEFTCSVCNRQFRAKFGLKAIIEHTYTYNIEDLRWSFSLLRDEQSIVFRS